MLPTLPVVILVFGTPLLLFFMLLPSFLELKKPKDAGPRLIMPDASKVVALLNTGHVTLFDIEEPYPEGRVTFRIRGPILDLEA
jgi:hypothetical protein